ncbi:MAG: hypothetical protein ACI90V_013830, partial [Bacillariaceae sp.]
QQHYSCCKQQLVFVLLVIVGSCLLLSSKITCAAAHQDVEVEHHQRYSEPRRLRIRSQIYQVIDDPNTNKRGLLNGVIDEASGVEFKYKQQRRLSKSDKSEIFKKFEKTEYNKEAKSNKASKVYVSKSEKSNEKVGKVGKVVKGQFNKKFQKSEKEVKGGEFAKKFQKRGIKSEKSNEKKARQAPSPDTMEGMMSSMSMELTPVDIMSGMSMSM